MSEVCIVGHYMYAHAKVSVEREERKNIKDGESKREENKLNFNFEHSPIYNYYI